MYPRPFSPGAPRSGLPALVPQARGGEQPSNAAHSDACSEKRVLLLSGPGPKLDLHCLRYLPLLVQRAKKVTLVAPDWLATLAYWTEPRIEVRAAARGADFDVRLRLTDVHESCRLRGTVPLGIPYINVPHATIRCSERRIASVAQGRPRAVWIGAAANGQLGGKFGLQLLRMPGVAWYNHLPSSIDRNILCDGSADRFTRLAPVFECLDLVLTDDPAIACLGGALGKETWLLTAPPLVEPTRAEMQQCFISVSVFGHGSPKLDVAVITKLLQWYNEHIDGLVRLSA
jgi:hypothetical protein